LTASRIQLEAREVSVALATDKKSRLCERCFANVPATEAFCPECGAAMSHDTGAEGSDSAVYPELARANLLRMRGDYKAAESQCLAILRRYPNNATANILLGDICAEKGDLDQSMQWYEMALDLTPESQAAQHKLESVKQRFKEKETAQTVEQLGLPTTKSKAGIYAFALIAAVFVFAVAMYFAGKRVGEKADPLRQPSVKATDAKLDPGAISPPVAGGNEPRSDQDLVKAIQSTGTEGARVIDAFQDPRTNAVVVTFSVLQGEDPRPLAAFIAQQAFRQVREAPVVTVRGVRLGQVAYVADALRTPYEETQAPNWAAEHQSSPNAWIDHILTREWPPEAPSSPAPTPITPVPVDNGGAPGDDAGAAEAGPAEGVGDKSEENPPNTGDNVGTDTNATQGSTAGDNTPPGDESATTTTGE
jgi:hypothetical protein